MSFLETSHVAEGPFGSSDPLADLIEFYRTNGYEVVDSTAGPRPSIMTWKAETEGDEPEYRTSGTADATTIEAEEASHDNPREDAEDAEEAADAEVAPDAAEAADADADAGAEVAPDANADAEVAPDAQQREPATPAAPNDAEMAEAVLEDGDDSAAEYNGIDESAENDEILLRVQLRRGKKGASIWSSNMAELLSDVDAKVIGNSIRVAYKIETTFQHFNDEDNAFWAQEAKQALRMAKGGKATDWRDNEEIRVSRQQKDIIMIGVQLAILAALLVAITYFAFNRA